MRILVVEDDKDTAEYVVKGLKEHGHVADSTADAFTAIDLARHNPYDVFVLDRMLTGLDGLSLLRTLRAGGIKTPAIFLSAMGSIEDRVQGLESGGDDYLVKPFAFAELYARICSLSRRPPLHEMPVTVLKVGDLEMNLITRSVRRSDKEIDLHPTEFRLLEYLLRNAGKVVTKTMLLESVWNFHFDPKTNVVETHISRLRAKVDRGFDQELILTVRGAGYRVNV